MEQTINLVEIKEKLIEKLKPSGWAINLKVLYKVQTLIKS